MSAVVGSHAPILAGELIELRGRVYRVAGFNAYRQPMLDEIKFPGPGVRERATVVGAPSATCAAECSPMGGGLYVCDLVEGHKGPHATLLGQPTARIPRTWPQEKLA